MVKVQTEILIRRRRDDVADYAANPDNAPGEPSGFSQLAGLFMAPMIRRATRKDLHKLKSILEAGAATKSDPA